MTDTRFAHLLLASLGAFAIFFVLAQSHVFFNTVHYSGAHLRLGTHCLVVDVRNDYLGHPQAAIQDC